MFARLRDLQAIERLSTDDLLRRQAVRLADILSYAADRCPYYREHWPRGGRVAPEDAKARLAELPFLSKRDLQESPGELIAQPRARRVTRKTTGGSTGEPVTVLKDREATASEMAASWLGYGWFGVRIGDRAARFWGTPSTVKRRLRFTAADFAMHRIRFSAFAFDDQDLQRYWARCVAYRPDYFYGYVSMLEAFADFVRRRGYDGASLDLKSVITTSEVLNPPQRQLIERTFDTLVQNEYGCGEVGPIAYECERGSLHVVSDNVLVEVLTADGRPAERGETGELVVTDLNNQAMPLIRYRLGDFGIRGNACPCGRGFPVLERVWGRAYDFVQTPDGRRHHGEYFMYLFEDLRASGVPVGQFQVVQSGPAQLEIAVVLREGDAAERRGTIHAHLARRLGEMRVTVRSVDRIPRSASGKMQVIRNDWLQSASGQRSDSAA